VKKIRALAAQFGSSHLVWLLTVSHGKTILSIPGTSGAVLELNACASTVMVQVPDGVTLKQKASDTNTTGDQSNSAINKKNRITEIIETDRY
jgi:hypothetical protein